MILQWNEQHWEEGKAEEVAKQIDAEEFVMTGAWTTISVPTK